MRVFLFDVENGIYAGEDFCDAHEIDRLDGVTVTAPPSYKQGHVAVYDPVLHCWNLVPIEVMRGNKNV